MPDICQAKRARPRSSLVYLFPRCQLFSSSCVNCSVSSHRVRRVPRNPLHLQRLDQRQMLGLPNRRRGGPDSTTVIQIFPPWASEINTRVLLTPREGGRVMPGLVHCGEKTIGPGRKTVAVERHEADNARLRLDREVWSGIL
jgi:hypothetical protein